MKRSEQIKGIVFILLGVIIFGGTVPFTKIALNNFTPLEIMISRLLLGGGISFVILTIRREMSLIKTFKNYLWKTALGKCLFPILLALSLEGLPANFGGVALGLIPFATSILAIIILKEKVKKSFFIYGSLGSLIVIGYSFQTVEAFSFHIPLIFFSIIICGIGYTYGASLAKHIGGTMSVCLSNGALFPFAILFCILTEFPSYLEASTSSLLSLLYLGVMSQLVGFFPFYTGLAKTGVAKGVQIQLLQPFVTLVISYILIDSPLGIMDIFVCIMVMTCVYFANKKPGNKKDSQMTRFNSSVKLNI